MTSRERIQRILTHQPVDRIGLYEHFWGDTRRQWEALDPAWHDVNFDTAFDFDMRECWSFNMVADLDYGLVQIAEDEDTVTRKDGNYATLRRHKFHDTTPEHIAFDVDCREKWEQLIKPKLLDETQWDRRIKFDDYRRVKAECAAAGKFFLYSGTNVFELMHPVCGHVNLLMAMIDDPEWVTDMCQTFSHLIVALQKRLFEREGLPDGVWFYEDMGYKGAPFMSPAMYEEFLYPAHRYTIDYAHGLGLPVIMHSCGFVEPLLDGMVRAGIDALQVIEIKAGMDPLRIRAKFGDRLALIGGIDVRALYSNDKATVDAELDKKIPLLKQGLGGYVLHSDHSIPGTVRPEIYRYFIERGLELGKID